MNLEWDEQKNAVNLEKHGLCFGDAAFVFDGPTITFEDDRKDYGEIRFITLGELRSRVVILVHTIRSHTIRIIFMRKANEREKKIYYEQLKKAR